MRSLIGLYLSIGIVLLMVGFFATGPCPNKNTDVVSGVVFVLAAAWPVARRLGLAYSVFILINILPPLAEGGMLSAGRFSSVLFPAFVWLAGAVPARQRTGWIASFAALQALNAALFYTWRPMF